MLIERAQSTPLFAATPGGPRQIVRVTLSGGEPGAPAAGPVLVRVEGAGISTPAPFRIGNLAPGTEHTAEVPVSVAAPDTPGSRRPVTVIAEGAGGRAEHAAEITVAETGWTIWMICHFHYDPVWWNTQGEFTQTQFAPPGEDGRLPDVRAAFELVRLHLDAARDDPDYKFVLAEIDYLKPYFDVHPEDRAELRELIAAGRVELVGGAYNEPNTNLTSAESTIRNIVYGLGHQRDVLGADPSVAWALDAFGHDPGYPGLMAAAGLTGSAWARGPYHQWGPWRTVGSNERMQFASEFEWVSPDGHGLLTGYMPNHYGAGWELHQAADAATASQAALTQFTLLAPVAATRNVLLPVGADHVIPARWATTVHRDFAARYAWPRCVTGLPREFFAAVRHEAAGRGVWLTPQTRDMNPVYPGKDVTYIDTKQAQRAAEVAVSDGERLATLAWLAGAEYPAEGLDKAWRQLVFGAHHDAITGTESDQVYLDLLGGWREAFERGEDARQEAVSFLAGLVNTQMPNGASAARRALAADAGAPAGSRPVVVFNTLSWPRRGLATVTLEFPGPGEPWLALHDDSGAPVPFLAEGAGRHAGGGLARVTLTFLAGLPALGYRTYWVSGADLAGASGNPAGWVPAGGTVIANEAFEVRADPAAGGSIAAIVDRRTGASLLRGPGNELVVQEEYASHPRWGEGPWLLSPKGPGTGSAGGPASVRAERCPAGSRLVAEFSLGGLRVCQETLLWDGLERVEFRTHVDGSIGQDAMLRVAFPADVPGGLPVFQAATAVVGRPFGTPGADVARHPFTLDNPAHEWFGLGSTARVAAGGRDWAIGVAEIIVPGPRAPDETGWREAVRGLVAALARAGVTATCTFAGGPRYGALDLDSNLPDCRIVLGGPEVNAWTGELLRALGSGVAGRLREALSAPAGGRAWVAPSRPRAEVFAPGADVRGPRDLPVLVVSGDDLGKAAAALVADLADAVIEAGAVAGDPVDPPLAARSVALLNRGTPSSLVTPDGTLLITLMRACSAWPCGVWIDGERRTVPDGSSFAWQHWSHTFGYALAAGPGDWRQAGFGAAGLEYNHDLIARETGVHAGPLPAAASLCSVSTPAGGVPAAVVSALKPRGNPLAAGQPGRPGRDGEVTVRLRDAGGQPGAATQAEVELFPRIAAGRLTGPTETPHGVPLAVRDGRAVIEVPPAGLVTAALRTAAGTAGLGAAAARPGSAPGNGPATEPAQPVFTRYWLHGKGPAPAGNLPEAVHLSPGQVALGAGGTGALWVTVACGPAPASGEVTLDVPPGLAVMGPGGPLCYRLPAGGHAGWDVRVRADQDAAPGRYFVAARIRDGLGQTLEDVALVTIGEPPPPGREMPRDGLAARLAADAAARTAELGVTLRPAGLEVEPGGCARLTVALANHTASEIRGECQLVSPFGSWEGTVPWARGFAASPGGATACEFTIAPPATARPGSHWWALAKVMYFGRVRYTECALIRVAAPAGGHAS